MIAGAWRRENRAKAAYACAAVRATLEATKEGA